MAAYGALVSLMHIIENLQNHPRPPISLDKNQVESLTENIAFLQDFLEAYNPHVGSKEADGLQSRIADAAYAAEDVIESHLVDRIIAQSTSTSDGEKISTFGFYQALQKVFDIVKKITSTDHLHRDLQKVIEDMDFIKKDITEIKEKVGIPDQLQMNSVLAGSTRSFPMEQNIMVGFDDILHEILDQLTGQQSCRQIIPIVGMGGIGKTTLTRNVYGNSLIEEYFDIRAWVTVSQECSIREILSVLLCQNNQESISSELREEELGVMLHKKLTGRRYLIIMDDVWSIEAWDKLKFYFPDNNNGSRIIVTTRISKVALHLTDTRGLEMNFLDEETSWGLLCKTVFGEDGCPIELEKIGKKIAKNCKGLALSIVVIGGLLAKYNGALKYWEYVVQNLNSIVNLDDDERCLQILYLSYNHLPVHLKPCFLYMGIFPEDHEIRVADLIKLWAAEGFLKPISDKSLEAVAEEYLKDLVDRNLILPREWAFSSGKIRSCNIHDLLRDLCLREAQKDKFLCVTKQGSLELPRAINTRVAIYEKTLMKEENFAEVHHASHRSFMCNFGEVLPSRKFRLLRVLKAVSNETESRYNLDTFFQLVNLRHLAIISMMYDVRNRSLPSSICFLWNLQTLIFRERSVNGSIVAPPEIWKMHLLRHIEIQKLYLPDPSSGQMDKRDDFVLGDLQTLLKIENFKCSDEVVKRIPNVKKLRISYQNTEEGFEVASHYCLNNLSHLHKLESLRCFFSSRPSRSDLVRNLTFPHTLKKLILHNNGLYWEDMNTNIGSLPHLEVLKLFLQSFIGPKWETVEGKFPSLRHLEISSYDDVEYWTTESNHFPLLEHLALLGFKKLQEMPSDIGEIPTLKSIHLVYCSESAVMSANQILEEQEELGNEGLRVRVFLWEENHQVQSLARRNFEVIC